MAIDKTKLAIRKRRYYLKHRDAVLKYHVEYNKKNTKKIKAWREKTKEHHREYGKTYQKNNRVRLQEYKNNRARTNPFFKLQKVLRARMLSAVKRGTKNGSAIKDLGCTIVELKLHLEKQFKDGMTWENHGLHGWHIDHIVPLAFFDLHDKEQFARAVHYTNLQPLWAKDNWTKGKKHHDK